MSPTEQPAPQAVRAATPEEQEAIDAAWVAVRQRDPEEFDRLYPAIAALAAALTPDFRLIAPEVYFGVLYWLTRHSDFGVGPDGKIVPVGNQQRHEQLAQSMVELRRHHPDFEKLEPITLTIMKAVNPIWGRIKPEEFLESAFWAAKYSSFTAPFRELIEFRTAPPVTDRRM